jgi:uncharacterized protein
MRKFLISAAFLCVMTAPAFAIDLQSARANGAVTELPTGYIEAAKASPEINSLVSTVNSKRKAEYERIAKEKKQPVDVVAKLAAQEIGK